MRMPSTPSADQHLARHSVEPAQSPHLSVEDSNNWQTWLYASGLRPEPFTTLESSADPNLGYYLVGHEAFAAAWGSWHSLVFAPPGGGKTALRVQTARACWVGQETNRPFPLPYTIPFLQWGHASPSLDDHLSALIRAAAQYLLLTLAHRPHWFFRLDSAARHLIQRVWDNELPGPLSDYLAPCRETRSLAPLCEAFPPAFVPPDPPSPAMILQFCDALEKTFLNQSGPRSVADRWNRLLDVLSDILGFPAVYILLDGLDGAPETTNDPVAGLNCLAPILPSIPVWLEERVFLKAFLPSETRVHIGGRFPNLTPFFQTAEMRWAPDSLAEVVRRRVYFASEGSFSSLIAIASPALSDLEITLAKAVLPLPREIIVLTHRLLSNAAQRDPINARIEEVDLKNALRWYAENKPEIPLLVDEVAD